MPVDDAAAQAALDALIARVAASGAIIAKGAALIVQRVGMQHTRVRSGTLRRSWRTAAEGPAVFVGPTTVYARRIELGFKGRDKLGRKYNQGPKPYVKPAFDEARPVVQAYAVKTVVQAITG